MAYAEFNILGNVGKITRVGETLRIRIASEYGRRDSITGDFNKLTFWNEVTVFAEKPAKWLEENLKPGDIVSARGTIRQNVWDKDGEAQYDVVLAAKYVDRVVAKNA